MKPSSAPQFRKETSRWVHCFVGAGSNVGDRKAMLDAARKSLAEAPAIRGLRMSPVYETDPIDAPPQGKFLNAVFEFESCLPADVLLEHLLEIEKSQGRERRVRKGPRTLDLDLLFWGDAVINGPGLNVPHPELQKRRFVLEPLCDLAPDFEHPVLKQNLRRLLEVCLETC